MHNLEPGAVASMDGGPPRNPELIAFLERLLEIQCALVWAVVGVVYLSGGAGRRPGLAARYASSGSPSEDVRAFFDPAVSQRVAVLAAELCGQRVEATRAGQGGPAGRVESLALASSEELYGAGGSVRVVASPLVAEGVTQGACVLGWGRGATPGAEESLTRLALTNARFEAFLWRQQAFGEGLQKARLREAMELLDVALQGVDAASMGSLLCHEVARRFGCTRVSLGLVRGEDLRLASVSGADRIDRRSAGAVALEEAMEECARQDVEVMIPPAAEGRDDPGQQRVTRAHEAVLRPAGRGSMLSLPLRVEGDLVGVLTLERDVPEAFAPESAALLRLVGEFAGPMLWTRRLADRGLLAVARDRALELGRVLVGPRYTAWKLLGLGVALVVALVSLIPIPARVTGEVEVVPRVSRLIVPPFSGYLSAVHAKPGDLVEEGALLAEMDARDIEQQLAQARAQREQLQFQRDEAQSQNEQAKQRVFQAQVDEAGARIGLLESQLGRTRVRSPIAGVVGRGDLEQLVGARVDPSQSMFEVVGEERRVVVRVRERDVHRVERGQVGSFTIRASPGREWTIGVERLTPMPEVVRGENVYPVECVLSPGQETAALLPGVTGLGEIREGRSTTLMARFLRPLADEVRLRWWWW